MEISTSRPPSWKNPFPLHLLFPYYYYSIPRNYVYWVQTPEPAKRFSRKFRLPPLVDIDAISAGFENGILEITVPRSLRRGFYIQPSDVPEPLQLLARAA